MLQIRSDYSFTLMLKIAWTKMSMLLWKHDLYSYFNQKYALPPMQINIAVSFSMRLLRFINFFIRYGKEPGTTPKRSLFDLVVNSQIRISVAFEIWKGISSHFKQLPSAFLTSRWIVFVCNCQLIILAQWKVPLFESNIKFQTTWLRQCKRRKVMQFPSWDNF